jgi:hypothetical protein
MNQGERGERVKRKEKRRRKKKKKGVDGGGRNSLWILFVKRIMNK